MLLANTDWAEIARELRPVGGLLVSGLAAFCGVVAWSVRRRDRAARRFWAGIAVLHGLLAIDAALAIRTGVTSMGRELARSEGWYGHRRPVQAMVVVLIVLALWVAGWWVWRRLRSRGWAYGAAVAGATLTLTMMLVSTVSLHQIDAILERSIVSVPLWALGVLVGNLAVMAGAIEVWRVATMAAHARLRDAYAAQQKGRAHAALEC